MELFSLVILMFSVGFVKADDQCEELFIQRGWPESDTDGIYHLTNETCDGVRYYERDHQPARYFYRKSNATWLLCNDICVSAYYGQTPITDQPWTTNFEDTEGAETEITCLYYSVTNRDSASDLTGKITLPSIAMTEAQPYLKYMHTAQLPIHTKDLHFNIESSNTNCSMDIQIFAGIEPDYKSIDDAICNYTSIETRITDLPDTPDAPSLYFSLDTVGKVEGGLVSFTMSYDVILHEPEPEPPKYRPLPQSPATENTTPAGYYWYTTLIIVIIVVIVITAIIISLIMAYGRRKQEQREKKLTV